MCVARDDEISEQELVQMHSYYLDTWMHYVTRALKAILGTMHASGSETTINWIDFHHNWHAKSVQALITTAVIHGKAKHVALSLIECLPERVRAKST